jgi:hypothetical protein
MFWIWIINTTYTGLKIQNVKYTKSLQWQIKQDKKFREENAVNFVAGSLLIITEH